ncbi:MAG: hypothetical protein LC713_04085, partial [Actinobacteria bacterium]|nr:hypothetical protein [Actinomycetota bacterium]
MSGPLSGRQGRSGDDPLGLGAAAKSARSAAKSARSAALVPRTESADAVVGSICPYCAVGCGQRVYASDGEVTHIEGDPDS